MANDFPTVFPADNPWKQDISSAAVSPYSNTIMARILSLYTDQGIRPDFTQYYGDGRELFGMPYNIVDSATATMVNFTLGAYASESDNVPVPIPANGVVVIEGDFDTGPNPGRLVGENVSDSHLIIWDKRTNKLYESFHAQRPNENITGNWYADQMSVWDLSVNYFRTLGWTSADAAGLPIFPGVVRPDEALPVELGGAGVVDHAIRVTLRNAVICNKYIYPASHTANPGNDDITTMPLMGGRIRLKASVNISNFKPQSKAIALAMKKYGMIIADNGSNFFFGGCNYSVDASNSRTLTWDNNDIHDFSRGMRSLHYSDFEFVETPPVVTGLSANLLAAGAGVTVTGKNFSGAAGRLKVFFGPYEAPAVSYVDDTHLLVTAPAGRGRAMAVVQSGVSPVQQPNNFVGPIFGYGRTGAVPAAAVAFPDHTPSALYLSSSSPAGDWKGFLGTDGYSIVGDATSLPSYASLSLSGQQTRVWSADASGDPRALQTAAGGVARSRRGLGGRSTGLPAGSPVSGAGGCVSPQASQSGGGDRIAASWYAQQWSADIDLADGLPHKVTVQILDWDAASRVQRIDVFNATTNALLDTRVESAFSAGRALSWRLQGHVRLTFTRTGGTDAVASGIFFDPPTPDNSATFVGTATSLGGNWKGVYGSEGYSIFGDATSLPAYADVGSFDAAPFVWDGSSTLLKAAQRAATGRIAATMFGAQFAYNVNTVDGRTHNVTFYLLDWDGGRVERIDALDPLTGAVLDSRTVSTFQAGTYVTWAVKGHVQFLFTKTAGINAVASALFFDAP